MRQQRNIIAFTLIEMLVVIGIIAILAAMITGVAIRVAEAKKIKRVDVEKNRLATAIEAYQAQMGSFPPDNGNNVRDRLIDNRASSATNQLFYELTGPTCLDCDNTPPPPNPTYQAFDNSQIKSNEYFTAFNRNGVLNSIQPKRFYNPPPKQVEYKSNFVANAANANVLLVPVDLNGNANNPWHYDSSSTNRHNIESFDVWAVFSVGSKIVTNGNWQ